MLAKFKKYKSDEINGEVNYCTCLPGMITQQQENRQLKPSITLDRAMYNTS